MSLFAAVYDPLILCTVLCVTLRSTHSDTGTVPQLLPTALPPCSWCHYSHTERSTSRRSLLREAGGRRKQGREKMNELMGEQLLPSAITAEKMEENANRNSCPNYQSFICVTEHFKKNIWEYICEVCEPISCGVCQFVCMCPYLCVWLHVYKCVQILMFDDNVSFTTGPLGFHWSLWARWILPAAVRKVAVWMTDGRAGKIK